MIHTAAELGFEHPVLTEVSPSGINLGYEFIALLFGPIYFYRNPKKVDIDDVIDAASRLRNKRQGMEIEQPKVVSPKLIMPKMNLPSMKKVGAPEIKIVPKKVALEYINPESKPLEFNRITRKDGHAIKVAKVCLSGYTLNKYLAEGTYGVVYKACNIDGNCNYVIKVQEFTYDHQIDEFKREANLSIMLNEYDIGSKVVGAWMCGSDRGFIVSELWDGDLKDNECISKPLVAKLKKQIEKLHSLDLVHGDILPKNILVKRDKNGKVTDVTLTDFGSVQSPTGWKKDQDIYGWIHTWYNYHLNFGNFVSGLDGYYKNNDISLKEVIADPALLDWDLIWWFDKYCNK
jgi:tRNA A-37 threonylcarbamoyl transferase component Bud32